MATIDYTNLFEGIRESIQQAKAQSSNGFSFDKVIKLKKPDNAGSVNEYMFRILPYIKEGKEGLHKTFFYYASYFWKTPLGENCNVLSRRTFGEPCYISNYYYDIQRHGTDYEKELTQRTLRYKQGWYCNIYVVNDPCTPSNNGKVMVLSLNKTLWTMVQQALNGQLDDEWSARATDANPTGEEVHVNLGRMVTDLTDNGVNFNVKVTSKGQYPDYSSSCFTRRDAKLHLTEDQQNEILNSCVDVTKIEKVRSAEEIKQYFDEKFRGVKAPENPATVAVSQQKAMDSIFGDDEIPGIQPEPTPAVQEIPNTKKDVDDFIKQLSSGNDAAQSFNFN